MIAEPKGKRGRRDPLFSDAFAHAIQQPGLEYGGAQLGPYSAMSKPSPYPRGCPNFPVSALGLSIFKRDMAGACHLSSGTMLHMWYL